jgi:FtsZ-binding cell division protein ZapB
MANENKYLQKKFELRHEEKIDIENYDFGIQTEAKDTRSVANSKIDFDEEGVDSFKVHELMEENENLKNELDRLITSLDNVRDQNMHLSHEMHNLQSVTGPELLESHNKVQILKK